MGNRIKKIVYISLLLCGSALVHAQQLTAMETLKKVEAHYKTTKTFHLNIEYAMYKGYTGTQLTESYTGSVYKNGDIAQFKILGSEALLFPEIQLTINEENKTLAYNLTKNKTLQSPLDMSSFLKFYKEVSTQISGNTIVIELVIKNNKLPVPYNKIIVHINKNDYSVQKQVLYLSTKVPFILEDGKETEDVGRMVITFKTNPKPPKVPQLQDYVILDPNKKPRLAKAYANYSIIDQSNI